jgi:hypothetical protein
MEFGIPAATHQSVFDQEENVLLLDKEAQGLAWLRTPQMLILVILRSSMKIFQVR